VILNVFGDGELREPQGFELRDEVEEKEILVTAGPDP
jgi:hypothetical protein